MQNESREHHPRKGPAPVTPSHGSRRERRTREPDEEKRAAPEEANGTAPAAALAREVAMDFSNVPFITTTIRP